MLYAAREEWTKPPYCLLDYPQTVPCGKRQMTWRPYYSAAVENRLPSGLEDWASHPVC